MIFVKGSQLGRILHALRMSAGLSVKEVADLLGVTLSVLALAEKGEKSKLYGLAARAIALLSAMQAGGHDYASARRKGLGNGLDEPLREVWYLLPDQAAEVLEKLAAPPSRLPMVIGIAYELGFLPLVPSEEEVVVSSGGERWYIDVATLEIFRDVEGEREFVVRPLPEEEEQAFVADALKWLRRTAEQGRTGGMAS